MNRRDLLKRAALVPVAIAAAPLVPFTPPSEALMDMLGDFDTCNLRYVARYTHQTYAVGYSIKDGVALNSITHPALTDAALGRTAEQIEADVQRTLDEVFSEDSLETIELEWPEHEFTLGSEFCIHCRAPAYAIEDALVPLTCWRNRP